MNNAVIDLSNIVWATRYKLPRFSKELLIHRCLNRIVRLVADTRSSGLMIACDGGQNWRKGVYPNYKGDRNHDADQHFRETLEAMEAIREFFNTCTSIPVIKVVGAEADDVIAYVARNMNDNPLTIISSDRDFVQLIGENVQLYDPKQKVYLESKDPDYDLFVKCIRGDRGDYIFSAFPRVRETRLARAWVEKDEMLNIMETVRDDGEKVGDVYQFNKSLIDLSLAPDDIKERIGQVIEVTRNDGSKYNAIKTLRYLGSFGLKNIAQDVDRYKRVFKMTFQH